MSQVILYRQYWMATLKDRHLCASCGVGDDEFLQTVACGRSGDPEVLYIHLNTGYGTKHWLVPGFMQGIPG